MLQLLQDEIYLLKIWNYIPNTPTHIMISVKGKLEGVAVLPVKQSPFEN